MNNKEQLKKEAIKEFEFDIKAHSKGSCSFSALAICSAFEQEIKSFLRQQIQSTREETEEEILLAAKIIDKDFAERLKFLITPVKKN